MVSDYEADVARLEEELKLALVERDPADEKDVIVEVRQGVGGDEAALWAADVARMLQRYAERRKFKWEEIEVSPSDGGGIKEATFAVKGDGAYSIYKFEGGTHRVQRVPDTESQGRIHTSTATVAVMPEAEEVDVSIDEKDLAIDVYRSSGPGGQSVNTTDSAVRITHLPTGISVAMQDERSQLQNRDKAMRVLRARLFEAERERQAAEQAAARLAQVGSGARAEKIRTYNFPQDRVTDHRVGVDGRLQDVLAGGLEPFTEALTADEQRRSLEGGLNLGEVLRAAAEYLERKGVDSPRLDAELLLVARARPLAGRAVHPARPAADRGRALGGARAGRAARAPRAARLRARRVGVPAADAADGRARARAAAGDGDRRRARPRARRGRRVAARRRRRHGHRARSRSRSPTSDPTRSVVATDVSPDALALARENAARLGLRVELRRSEPPRRSRGAVRSRGLEPAVRRSPRRSRRLQPEVRDWEPRLAVVGDGQTEALVDAAPACSRRAAAHRARGARASRQPGR